MSHFAVPAVTFVLALVIVHLSSFWAGCVGQIHNDICTQLDYDYF